MIIYCVHHTILFGVSSLHPFTFLKNVLFFTCYIIQYNAALIYFLFLPDAKACLLFLPPQVPINGRVGKSTIGRSATTQPGVVGWDGNGHLGTRKGVEAIRVNEVTAISAVVAWLPVPSAKGVRMYQIHYNCSSDEPLVYR